jgi:hypothetical protein
MKVLHKGLILVLLAAFSTPLSAADLTGRWNGEMVLGMAATRVRFVLDLKLDGATLSGTFCFRDCSQNKQPILNAKIDGNAISFGVISDGDVPRIDFQGKVTDDTIKFDLSGMPDQCGGASCHLGNASAIHSK